LLPPFDSSSENGPPIGISNTALSVALHQLSLYSNSNFLQQGFAPITKGKMRLSAGVWKWLQPVLQSVD
jgi:hypothetical protein